MIKQKSLDIFRIKPGKSVELKKHNPGWAAAEFKDLEKDELKSRARAKLAENLADLSAAQDRLYASDSHSVLVILQAMDAAGKDGLIKHVMSGLNPQGCQVFSFKVPSAEELDHNFLWRYTKGLPERGRIGIFNRSYYEETLVVRVHPDLLLRQKLPEGKRGHGFWRERFEDINNFEQHLSRNGTRILKFFLHVSKDEQKRRFLERIDTRTKNWKFSLGDIEERGHWSSYMRAYEETLSATSTEWAPWHVIPADHKWVARAIVADIMTKTMKELKSEYPRVGPDKQRLLREARKLLLAEK